MKKSILKVAALSALSIPILMPLMITKSGDLRNSNNLITTNVQENSAKTVSTTRSSTKLVDFDRLKTGDFFVQFETHDKITDLVNHAGFIEKISPTQVRIFESMPDIGVDYRRDASGKIMTFNETSFTNLLKADDFIVLRAQKLVYDSPWWELWGSDRYADADGQKAFDKAKTYAGLPYDWDFDKDYQDQLYCSELIWKVFLDQGIDLDYAPPLPLPWIVMPTELWMDEEAHTLYDYRDF